MCTLFDCTGFASRAQGYGASSLWKQRAHRWTVSALRITGKSLHSFFTYDTRGGVLSNIAFRLYRYILRSMRFCFGRALASVAVLRPNLVNGICEHTCA